MHACKQQVSWPHPQRSPTRGDLLQAQVPPGPTRRLTHCTKGRRGPGRSSSSPSPRWPLWWVAAGRNAHGPAVMPGTQPTARRDATQPDTPRRSNPASAVWQHHPSITCNNYCQRQRLWQTGLVPVVPLGGGSDPPQGFRILLAQHDMTLQICAHGGKLQSKQ